MTIKGELSQIKLADILQMVALNGQEGTLVVSDADSKKWLYFSRDGVSLLSSGKRQPTSLGQRLLAQGKLTKQQLDDAVLEYRKTGKKLGQVLTDRGLVSKDEVEVSVREQIADAIFDLLEWEGAQFEFIPGPPLDNLSTQPIGRHLAFDVNSILLEAAKRADEWDLVKHKIGTLSEVLVPCTVYKTQLDLSGELTAAFALVDGKASIREIIHKLHMPRIEAAKTIAVLIESGAVRPINKEEVIRLAQSPALQGSYDKQAELYELAVQRGDDPALRQRWAEVLERAGQRELSAAQYKHLAESSLAQGDLHAGADFLRQVVRLAPNDKESRERLIDILLRLKSPAQATIQIRRLAQVYAEEGQITKAIEEYRRLLKLSPGDFEAKKQLVELYVREDHIEEAFSEAESLEALAKTPSEHEQVVKFFGRLVATRPGFTAAQRKLERIARQERRKISVRRYSRRVLVVGVVAFVILAGTGAYEWLAAVSFSGAIAHSDELARKGDFQAAIAVLRQNLGHFPYSRAHRTVERKIRELLAQQQQSETERQTQITTTQKLAEELEAKGDYKGAAEKLLWVAKETKADNYLTSFQLEQKAAELLDFWDQAERMLKRSQELMQRPDGCQEAHTEALRLWKRFPSVSDFLGAGLPVQVTSVPPGAEVAADGKPAGKTPVIVMKKPGKPLALSAVLSSSKKISKTLDNDNDWQVVLQATP